jgi:hypothetical protein
MYWLGTVKISNFLNSLLHEVLGCAPTIILVILFSKINIFLLLEEFPPKITVTVTALEEVCSNG